MVRLAHRTSLLVPSGATAHAAETWELWARKDSDVIPLRRTRWKRSDGHEMCPRHRGPARPRKPLGGP